MNFIEIIYILNYLSDILTKFGVIQDLVEYIPVQTNPFEISLKLGT
jgi:hypothetical protein